MDLAGFHFIAAMEAPMLDIFSLASVVNMNCRFGIVNKPMKSYATFSFLFCARFLAVGQVCMTRNFFTLRILK